MQLLTNSIINDGLVFYIDTGIKGSYPGNGNIISDLAGINNGTLIGTPAFSSANGGILTFNGSNYITYGTSNVLAPVVFTISIVVRFSSVNRIHAVWWKTSDTGFARDWTISIEGNNTIDFWFGNNNPDYIRVLTTETVAANTWYWLTFRRSGTTASIARNGAVLKSQSYAFTPTQKSHPCGMAFDNTGAVNYEMTGSIAIGMIYNRSLTVDEDTYNFNIARKRFGI